MKTLILNGSPRINGDTSSLINKITEEIAGEYKIVDAYRCNISPCLDCRYCWKNNIFAPDFLERKNRSQNLKRVRLY